MKNLLLLLCSAGAFTFLVAFASGHIGGKDGANPRFERTPQEYEPPVTPKPKFYVQFHGEVPNPDGSRTGLYAFGLSDGTRCLQTNTGIDCIFPDKTIAAVNSREGVFTTQ